MRQMHVSAQNSQYCLSSDVVRIIYSGLVLHIPDYIRKPHFLPQMLTFYVVFDTFII